MRIGLIQMRCEKAAVQQNLALIEHHLDEAAALDVDVVGFPEMSLTGYARPTGYPGAVVSLDGPEVAQLLARTRPHAVTALVGIIEQNPAGKPYITQLVVRQGELVGVYRKITIKDEEVDWFSPGDAVTTFEVGNRRLGIAICADIHNEQVFADNASHGAELVFELAAPGLYGDQATRNWQSGYRWWEGECAQHFERYSRRHGIWVVVATQAGRTIDEDFPGGGYVFSPKGERLYTTANEMPGAVYLDLDFVAGGVTLIAEAGTAD